MKNHPKGLFIAFISELWDRMNYYGIQSILILYLTKTFLLSDSHAYAVFGIYSSLAFCTPILGGIIGDRWINTRQVILLGIAFIIIGNAILLAANLTHVYTGLSFIICGIGLFKSNNANLLGSLYQNDSMHRESGYTIFYMGMNVGAIIGPLLFGFLSLYKGFNIAFIVNIITFSTSFILFLLNKNYYNKITNNKQKLSTIHLSKKLFIYLGIIILIAIIYLFFKHASIFSDIVAITAIVTIIAIIAIAKKQTPVYQNNILVLMILNLFSITYFASSLQIYSSITLFINRSINTNIFGFHIPTAAFSSFEPFAIIVASLALAPLWTHLEKKHHAPSLINRILLGLIFSCLSFILFTSATKFPALKNLNVPLLLILAGNVLLGLGELCIAPAMIASVNYLLPKNLRGTFIGAYFLMTGFAAYISTIIAKMNITSPESTYFDTFTSITIMTFIASIILWVIRPLLCRLYRRIQPD